MKFVAVTSCPTGIAHTYMAAEALEQAGKAAGHEVTVETQGSAGTDAIDDAAIAAADGVIYAADLEVKGRERFAGKPFVDVGVKRGVHEAAKVIEEAVAAVERGVPAGSAAAAPAAGGPATKVDANASVGTKIRQWLMTGVSYMIPFVAAGGILIALAFMLANVAWGGAEGAIEVTAVDQAAVWADFDWGNLQHYAVALLGVGGLAFGFLVPVLSGFIAYGIADRPGLVPGFVGGAASVAVGAGFLGGLVTGFLAGFVALWISRWKVAKGVRGIMPVVVIPLLSSLIVGFLTLVVIGTPIAALMRGLESWLGGLGGNQLVLLGLILGAMMGFDLGGPVNKVAYTFAVTGLATTGLTADAAQYKIMAAVMASGMVAPLAMALATTVRKRLFTEAERENGKAAWLLGASFISEGAIPFAAADPLRVILASLVGSSVTGALSMAFGVTLVAPHGGVWVLPLIGNPIGFLISIIAGVLVAALIVVVLKEIRYNKINAAQQAPQHTAVTTA
ncbi:PTS fructose transporter subunit IIC [Jonesia quinghaiensis]|uniref:PTS fructose transporter subunit IIC n=1 Tax=Jonesia quinghaiensis TaxID=262806 RepID=UPI00040646B8|nr:fructose-specific PTS transporter subunit EIIC [Jonesia quinghaiensis]